MARIAVIGTGAWGTTLARMAALEQIRVAQSQATPEIEEVVLWEHQPERAQQLQWERINHAYLPGYALPANLRVTADVGEAVRGRDVVLLVTPSQRVRENIALIAPYLSNGAVVVCASKGLEIGTHLRMTQIVAEYTPARVGVAALSGPNLAFEIAKGLPAAAVVASDVAKAAERVRHALSTPRFRVYTSDDVIGVELGGALKNIVALGVGASDGLEYGDNAKATFITRALAEISRLSLAAGANPLTLAGLAGLGDLIATCTSPLSRNRTLGMELARGRPLAEALAERKTVVEGVYTTKGALELADVLDVELPITYQIGQVLFEGKPIRDAVSSLMTRDPKRELEGL